MCAAVDHPTIRRLNRSITTAGYNQPSSVSMWVRSADHFRFGPVAAKSRANKLSATGLPWPLSVVRGTRRGHLPCISRRFITLATVFSLAVSPLSRSGLQMRGLPWMPRLS